MMWFYYDHTSWFVNERNQFWKQNEIFKTLRYISPWIVLFICEAPYIRLDIDLSLYFHIFIAVSSHCTNHQIWFKISTKKNFKKLNSGFNGSCSFLKSFLTDKFTNTVLYCLFTWNAHERGPKSNLRFFFVVVHFVSLSSRIPFISPIHPHIPHSNPNNTALKFSNPTFKSPAPQNKNATKT